MLILNMIICPKTIEIIHNNTDSGSVSKGQLPGVNQEEPARHDGGQVRIPH